MNKIDFIKQLKAVHGTQYRWSPERETVEPLPTIGMSLKQASQLWEACRPTGREALLEELLRCKTWDAIKSAAAPFQVKGGV